MTHLKPEESSAAEHWDALKVFYNLSTVHGGLLPLVANFLLSLEEHSNCLASEALCHTWQCPPMPTFLFPFCALPLVLTMSVASFVKHVTSVCLVSSCSVGIKTG